MSARDLIDAIESGNALAIENAFNTIMAEKISSRLENMRTAVSKNMFNEGSCSTKKEDVEVGDLDVVKSTNQAEKRVGRDGITRTVYSKEAK